jgi:hypothetical protein
MLGTEPPPLTGAPSHSRSNQNEDPDLLSRLAMLIENGDGSAIDLATNSATQLDALLGEAKLRQLTVALQEFDFDGALAALNAGGDAPGGHD